MVHGAGGSIEVWYRQVAEFARHYNLLLVDLAGHGGSANVSFSNNFNFIKAADQVMEVVDYLNIKRGHFMGLSLGTIIVRLIAKQHPDRVASMILAGAVTQLSAKIAALMLLAKKFRNLIPYSVIKKLLVDSIVPKAKYSTSKNLFINEAKKVSFDSFLNWLDLGNRGGRFIKDLFREDSEIPTLYLMGEDDRFFLPYVKKTVRRSPDNVCLFVVPEAGHVCNVDNKKFFNQMSLAFIEHLTE